MARMAQYIGLTAAARRYVDTKLIAVPVGDQEGDRLRNHYYDLADNEHPLGVWKDPASDTYYVETVQATVHSGGPMYFTHICAYKLSTFVKWVGYYESWKPQDVIHRFGAEYDKDEGVIYNIAMDVVEARSFDPLECEIYYVQDCRHFVWRGNEQPVILTFQDSGFRLLNQNKVMLMQINDLPYLVKADANDRIFSIQLLDCFPELNDLNGISRKTVPNLIFDINSAAYKRFR